MGKNSMTISMEIEGLDEAIHKLKLYDAKNSKAIAKAISKSGRNIRDDAKSHVPVRTGTLRDSLAARFKSSDLQSVVKADYKKAPHAHLIEYGVEASIVKSKKQTALKFTDGITIKYARGPIKLPARKARPFMNPAFQSEKPKVENEIKKILKDMP
jgi:HK97 gp10 family phage protein|nr:MAG TPA: Minor capsid protein [Caudoviricetes sp.]